MTIRQERDIAAPIQELSAELTALFIKAINGEASIKPTDCEWNEAYAGECRFNIGGYLVTFFNDCQELDYTDHVTAPDGRKARFDDWHDNHCDPIDALTEQQHILFEHLLEDAKL